MDYTRTILIFIHLIVFAFAITTLYKSDIELLFRRPSAEEIKEMGNHMAIYLLILWITGLGVIYIDTNFGLDKILSAQKLLTKLSCVIILTLNAFVIHFVVFKKLAKKTLDQADMKIMSISGAVSSASWTFAGFLGIARPLVKHMNLAAFMSFYVLVVACAAIGALMLTPFITKQWTQAQRRVLKAYSE